MMLLPTLCESCHSLVLETVGISVKRLFGFHISAQVPVKVCHYRAKIFFFFFSPCLDSWGRVDMLAKYFHTLKMCHFQHILEA